MEALRNKMPWTEPEDAWLIENFGNYTLSEMAKKLERTKHAVRVRASDLRRAGEPICRSPKPGGDDVSKIVGQFLSIPKGKADGYWMEVTNATGKVMGVYTLKNVEQVRIVSTRYFGPKYIYRVRRIINGEVIWKEEKQQ